MPDGFNWDSAGPPVQADDNEGAQRATGNFARNKQWLRPGVTDFQTKLAPDEEKRFQAWVRDNKVPFEDSPQADYDMRGYWKASQDKDAWKQLKKDGLIPKDLEPGGTKIDPNDGKPHFPDWWKTPYHETFSDESQFALHGAAPRWNAKDQLVAADGSVLFDDKAQKPPAAQVPNPATPGFDTAGNPLPKGWMDKEAGSPPPAQTPAKVSAAQPAVDWDSIGTAVPDETAAAPAPAAGTPPPAGGAVAPPAASIPTDHVYPIPPTPLAGLTNRLSDAVVQGAKEGWGTGQNPETIAANQRAERDYPNAAPIIKGVNWLADNAGRPLAAAFGGVLGGIDQAGNELGLQGAGREAAGILTSEMGGGAGRMHGEVPPDSGLRMGFADPNAPQPGAAPSGPPPGPAPAGAAGPRPGAGPAAPGPTTPPAGGPARPSGGPRVEPTATRPSAAPEQPAPVAPKRGDPVTVQNADGTEGVGTFFGVRPDGKVWVKRGDGQAELYERDPATDRLRPVTREAPPEPKPEAEAEPEAEQPDTSVAKADLKRGHRVTFKDGEGNTRTGTFLGANPKTGKYVVDMGAGPHVFVEPENVVSARTAPAARPTEEPATSTGKPSAAAPGKSDLTTLPDDIIAPVSETLDEAIQRMPDGATHVRVLVTDAEREALRAAGVDIDDMGMVPYSDAQRLVQERMRRVSGRPSGNAAARPTEEPAPSTGETPKPEPAGTADLANAPNGPWEPVGKNADGETVYRNPQGVHAVNESGVPWMEATQDGKPTAPDARKPTFQIVEPTPEQPVAKADEVDLRAADYMARPKAKDTGLSNTRNEWDAAVHAQVKSKGRAVVTDLDGQPHIIVGRKNQEWVDANDNPVRTVDLLNPDHVSAQPKGEAGAEAPPEQAAEEPAPEQEAASPPEAEAPPPKGQGVTPPPVVPTGAAPSDTKDETKPKPEATTAKPATPKPAEPKPAATTPAAPKGRTVYSGSGRADQGSVYNPLSAGTPIAGEGKYWAFTEDHAKNYGPNVETGTLDLKKPLVINSDDQWRALTKRAGWEFPNPTGLPKAAVEANTKRLKDIVTGDGHDGIVFDWDDDSPGDSDSKTGKPIKLVRDVIGHPQAVDYRPQQAAPAAPAPTAESPPTAPAEAETKAAKRIRERHEYNRDKGFGDPPSSDLPPVGAVVHLRTQGSRGKPTAYTISGYKELNPGEWVYTAVDERGGGFLDGIASLQTGAGSPPAAPAAPAAPTTTPAPATAKPKGAVMPVGDDYYPPVHAGERLWSKSGREMSPVPNFTIDTNRAQNIGRRKLNEWLVDEAQKEVAATGDTYLASFVNRWDGKNFPPADRDHAIDILWGNETGPGPEHRTAPAAPASPQADAAPAQYGRRQVLNKASVNLPDAVKWRHVSEQNRAKLLAARSVFDPALPSAWDPITATPAEPAPSPQRTPDVDRLAQRYGVPTEGRTDDQILDALVEKMSPDEAALVGRKLDKDRQAAYDEAEKAALDWILYHGTPHLFDRFDISKIGIGEGNQAYGRGLYLAENEDVAAGYRERLSGKVYFHEWPPEQQAAAGTLTYYRGDREAAIQNLLGREDPLGDAAAELLRQGWDRPEDPGYLYTVRVKATPEEMLDWDKPLSEQPATVKKLFQAGWFGRGALLPNGKRGDPAKLRGESLYRAMAEAKGGSDAAASEAFRAVGIKGIRYLDAGSRASGDGSRNVVIFDDRDVEIIHRDGQKLTQREKIYDQPQDRPLEDLENEQQTNAAPAAEQQPAGDEQSGPAGEDQGPVQDRVPEGGGDAGAGGGDAAQGGQSQVAPPAGITIFRSGANNPPDARAYIEAGVPFGVSFADMGPDSATNDMLIAYAKQGGAVFVDSGAFTAFTQGKRVDFDKVLTRQLELAKQAGGARLHFVMPDVIGNQAETLRLIKEHAGKINELIALGQDVLVPLQKGDLTPRMVWEDVQDILGTDDFTAAIPFNKVPFTDDDLRDLYGKYGNGPERIHLLGIAGRKKKLARTAELLRGLRPDVQISADANRITAGSGQRRPITTGRAANLENLLAGLWDAPHPDLAQFDETELAGDLAMEPGFLSADQAQSLAEALGVPQDEWPTWVKAAEDGELNDLMDERDGDGSATMHWLRQQFRQRAEQVARQRARTDAVKAHDDATMGGAGKPAAPTPDYTEFLGDTYWKPRVMTEAKPLVRSVSLPELLDIVRTGKIAGRLNTFNDFDRRRLVFFGSDDADDQVIGQGEEIARQVQLGGLDADQPMEAAVAREAQADAAVEAEIDRLIDEDNAKRQKRGEKLVDKTNADVRRYFSPRVSKNVSKAAWDARQVANDARKAWRKEYNAKIGVEEKRRAAQPYTSAVIRTKPIGGGLEYSYKFGGDSKAGMKGGEIGFPSGFVTLGDIESVSLVKDGKYVGTMPVGDLPLAQIERAAQGSPLYVAQEPAEAAAPPSTDTAEPAPSDRPKDANGNPIFKTGERVVIAEGDQHAGRHGEVINATGMVWQSVYGGQKSAPSYHYEVRTDGGLIAHPTKLEPETGEAPQVAPDPVYHGHAMDPESLKRGIDYDKQTERKAIGAEARARTPNSKREHRNTAAGARNAAADKQAILDAWIAANPEAAKIAFPEAAPGAAPAETAGPVVTDGSNGMTLVETKHGKTGERLFVVTMADRVPREQYDRMVATARENNGRYSSYRGGGAIPGWTFKARDDAERFMQAVGGAAPAAAPAAPAAEEAAPAPATADDAPQVLRTVPNAEAIEILHAAYFGGKNAGLDPAPFHRETEDFVLVNLPLSMIRPNEQGDQYDATADMDRVRDYAKKNITTPIFATQSAWGTRQQQEEGGIKGAYVADGGHRVSAARLRGDTHIISLMRESDFGRLMDTFGLPRPNPPAAAQPIAQPAPPTEASGPRVLTDAEFDELGPVDESEPLAASLILPDGRMISEDPPAVAKHLGYGDGGDGAVSALIDNTHAVQVGLLEDPSGGGTDVSILHPITDKQTAMVARYIDARVAEADSPIGVSYRGDFFEVESGAEFRGEVRALDNQAPLDFTAPFPAAAPAAPTTLPEDRPAARPVSEGEYKALQATAQATQSMFDLNQRDPKTDREKLDRLRQNRDDARAALDAVEKPPEMPNAAHDNAVALRQYQEGGEPTPDLGNAYSGFAPSDIGGAQGFDSAGHEWGGTTRALVRIDASKGFQTMLKRSLARTSVRHQTNIDARPIDSITSPKGSEQPVAWKRAISLIGDVTIVVGQLPDGTPVLVDKKYFDLTARAAGPGGTFSAPTGITRNKKEISEGPVFVLNAAGETVGVVMPLRQPVRAALIWATGQVPDAGDQPAAPPAPKLPEQPKPPAAPPAESRMQEIERELRDIEAQRRAFGSAPGNPAAMSPEDRTRWIDLATRKQKLEAELRALRPAPKGPNPNILTQIDQMSDTEDAAPPAPAAITGTTTGPFPDWATKHEPDVGGRVIYADPEVALMEGYSMLDGLPVYLGVTNGGLRTKVDIDGFTGKFITPAQIDRLKAAKAEAVARDKAAHDAHPEGPFQPGQKIAHSRLIKPSIAALATEWLNMLGLGDHRVFIADPRDVTGDAGDAYNLNGPYAAIRSAGVDRSENGSMRRLSNGDYYIALGPQPRLSATMETLAHEIGHIVEREMWKDAPKDMKDAVQAAFNQFLADTKDEIAPEYVKRLRSHTVGKLTAPTAGTGRAEDLRHYWRSFSEWFADQVARWATTDDTARTKIDQMFARIGAAQKRLAESATGGRYLPADQMRQWLNSKAALTDGPQTTEDAAPAVAEDEAAPADAAEPAAQPAAPTPTPAPQHESWAPEIHVEGKWSRNGLRFATKEEAEASASDLYSRWTMAKDHRATEATDPVNYRWDKETGLQPVETPPIPADQEADDGVQDTVSPGDAGAGAENVPGTGAVGQDGRPPASQVAGGASNAPGSSGVRTKGPGRPAGDGGEAGGGGDSAGDPDRVPDTDGPRPTGTTRRPAGPKGENYRIEPGALAESRGPMEKARDNLAAIELAQRLDAEKRPATQAEQKVLAKYVGWGGLSGAFRNPKTNLFGKGFDEIGARLKELLTPEAYEEAENSTQYAHYTAEHVVRSMWDAVRQLGFKGGSVFEPGMGVGHFLGLMPADLGAASQYRGVEMDPTTAQIARLLYPRSGVKQADFKKFPLAEEAFDLVIGNPPFSDAVVKSDPKYAPRRFALHDYFFAKSLDAVRPGGLLAFITSAGTMNKMGDKARKYLAERAEFLGGVRLPNDAFQQNAGTGVTADILFFQRRPEGKVRLETSPDWTQTVIRTMPNREGELVSDHVNQWFTDRPETVLGEEGFFDKLLAGDRYAVRPRKGADLPAELASALSRILPHDVMTEPESPEDRAAIDFDATQRKDGTFYVGDDGRLMRYSQGAGHPVLLRGKQGGNFTKEETDIIRGLIPIRDALRDVFRGDLARDEAISGPARVALNKAYDAFVAKFGPINKAEYTYSKPNLVQIEQARLEAREEARSIDDYWNDGDFDPSEMIAGKSSVTAIAKARQFARDTAVAAGRKFNEGSFDPDDVPDTVRVKLLNIRPFRSDPESYRLRSIEEYNDTTGKGEKRDIFRRNILTYEEEPEIKSVEDGVLWSMNKIGRFDLDAIAEKMGQPRADIIEALGDKVFQVPYADDTHQLAEEYVSGDVVSKLEEAKRAARSDADFERNVKALEAALPRPYAPGEIRINIGMPWIPAAVIREFVEDHLDLGPTSVAFVPEVGAWTVVGSTTNTTGGRRKKYSWEKDKVTAGTAQWGTADRTAHELVSDALNRTQIRITHVDPYDRKKTIFDPVATQTAVDKVEEIKQAFRDWVAADVERGDNLATIFNTNLNRTVLRQFNGDYLKTPGIASHWKWRPHQTRVIARIIQVGNTYMAHAVGAGKTSAMIASGMEMRRLGLVKKPMYIVPNHMLGQFAKEFYEQYPTARIMVADEANFHTDTRKQFVSNVATSDLDAVIITHSSFGHIPISGEFQDHLIAEEVEILLDAISQLDEDKDRITVKKLRNRMEKLREKLSGQGGSQKDQTFTFEEMGVDFLFVDEAHMFRKLSFATKLGNLKGIASDGSNMAWDLYTKGRYLETQRPGRSLVMASGTPVTNTMGELYTVSRFMQPQALANNGVSHFDSWVQTFADTQTKLEQTPAGDYAPQTRLSRFMNMPTLYKMVAQGMDIVTSKELDQYVTRPKLMGDKRQFHLAPRTPVMDNYQASLAERVRLIKARRGPPEKGDDILLSVINDGRHAAIDPRFVEQSQNDPRSKLNMMLDNVARIWSETTDHQFYYPANDYKEKAFKGPATQMIFANLGVNPRGPGNFSGYAWMKAALMRKGIPANEIAFIGDYDTHVKRQSLFNDMNEGKVRILIGSVQKMGTGVNAQRRLVAVHNQDPLWFPADDEQRNGRMLRQGNMNPEVQIHDYSTKGTYDAVMWDMMGRKGRFIEQFFRGDPNLMEMEDLGEAGMFEQAAGMATTDERVLELTEMKQELEKQERRAMGFEREQYEVRQKIKGAEWYVTHYTEQVEKADQDIARRQDTRGKAFRMTVNGEPFTERKKATEALVAAVKDAREGMAKGSERTIGSLGGFPLVFGSTERGTHYANLRGALSWSVYDDPEGTVMSAENKLRTMEDDRQKWLKEAATHEAEAAAYRPQLERKFELGDQINALKEKVRALEAELKGEAKKRDEDAQAAIAGPASDDEDEGLDDDAAD